MISDGSFQRLRPYSGDHTIEVFLPRHRSLTQRIYLQPGKTFTVRAALEPLAPGEPESVRPSDEAGAQSPPQRARPSAIPQDSGGEEWPPQKGPGAQFGSLALRVQPGGAAATIDGDVVGAFR